MKLSYMNETYIVPWWLGTQVKSEIHTLVTSGGLHQIGRTAGSRARVGGAHAREAPPAAKGNREHQARHLVAAHD